MRYNPPGIRRYIFSLIGGILNYSSPEFLNVRPGASPCPNAPFLSSGKGDKAINSRRYEGEKGGRATPSDLTGEERLTAISRALVYLRRRGAEREGLTLRPQCFVLFDDLCRIRNPLRKMRAVEADVRNIIDTQEVDKSV